MNRVRRPGLWIALALMVLGATPGRGRAADGPEKRGRALLDEVAAAYRALPAYADHGEFVMTLRFDGTASTQRLPAAITLERPNKLRVEAGSAQLVCDGATLTTVVGPSKKYASAPAPKQINLSTLALGPVGSLLLGGPSGPPLAMIAGLLLADDPAKAVLDQGDSIEAEDDRPFEGQTCQVLRVNTSSASGTAYRLLIDPKTHLLRAIEVAPDPKALAELFPSGDKVVVEMYRWVSGAVSTQTPAAAAFAAELPKDFAKLGTLAELAKGGDDAPKFQVQDATGKTAPDFTLTVFDGEKTTKTLARADFAGKVVVIDFWATWCGPCLAELPEVQKLVEGYAKAKKNVVVVALSQDSDPKDPIEVRKLIEKTLDAKKIVLTGNPVGMIGLDPSNSVGEAFKVEGYPTVVILDGKGVVRAAHVGFSPEVGKTLAREIDALLEGKPIPKDDTPAK